MLALLLIALASAPQPRLFLQPNLRGPASSSASAPAFSFTLAPPASACGCVADGRLTVTSGATFCVKGNEWSGIQPGDLVACPANVPRWMPGGDGTGAIGLQAWEGATNQILHSQAFDHADWSKQTSIVAAAAVTPNACLAPDGTMTADMIHFPSVPVFPSRISALYQTTCDVAPNVRTIYARTVNPDAGLTADDGGALSGQFMFADGTSGNLGAFCNHTSSGYTRCRQFDDAGANLGSYFWFGVDSDFQPFAEQYVCVWQADCQAFSASTPQNPWPPPIATVASGVSRTGDVIEANAFYFPQWSDFSIKANVVDESGATINAGSLVDINSHIGASGNTLLRTASDTAAQCQFCSASACTLARSTTTFSSSADILQCLYDGDSSILGCINNGGCGDAGIDAGSGPQTALTLGSHWNGFVYQGNMDGVLKNFSITESARKDIYLFGDSIVEGHTAGPGFEPQYLIHGPIIGSAVNIRNNGVSGENSAQCRARLLTQLNYVTDAGLQRRSYFMMQCGINNIDDAGCVDCGAGAGVLGDLTDAMARTQDAGIHALWGTVTPFVSQKTNIATVNNAMTAWCPGNHVSIADTFTAMQDPNTPGALNPLLDYGDHEHPNDAGVWVETNVWVNSGGWK